MDDRLLTQAEIMACERPTATYQRGGSVDELISVNQREIRKWLSNHIYRTNREDIWLIESKDFKYIRKALKSGTFKA